MSQKPNPLAVDYVLQQPIKLRATFEIHGFTALLGRSGAGKTSLLKALAGLLPATGTPWNGLAPELRPVGYLPQNTALFPHLTTLENIAYPMRGNTRFAQAQALLTALGLADLAARNATKLSGGQAQRVALARALARNPQLLLLDEPSAGLDTKTRDATLTWLIDTANAHNLPALAATHDFAIAGLANWVVLLADGRIIQQGYPGEIFNNPKTAAAAELLGYENIWQDRHGLWAIRASEIELAPTGVTATVSSVREYGTDLRLECNAPHPMIVQIKSGKPVDFKLGDTIYLRFGTSKLVRLEPS